MSNGKKREKRSKNSESQEIGFFGNMVKTIDNMRRCSKKEKYSRTSTSITVLSLLQDEENSYFFLPLGVTTCNDQLVQHAIKP